MSDTKRTEAVGKVAEDFQAIGNAARQTGDQVRQAGADALDQARDVAQEATSRAASALGTLGEEASSVAEAQKASLAERIEDVAKAVHKSSEQLEGHQDWVAKLVEQGADELVALATTLRSNDVQSLLGDLGSLARRQPALFVGASMAAGFALTRIGRLSVSDGSAAATSPSQPSTAPTASTPPGSARPAPIPPSAPVPASAPTGAAEVGRERF
jgi:hypothetical protein